MAYVRYKIIGVVEDQQQPTARNPVGGTRIRVRVSEVVFREAFINLTKSDASVINQFRALTGKIAMIPCREGSVDGNPFVSLEPGEIIELPSSSSDFLPKQK